ncbi:glycoside hydrolase family 115 protein [Cucurbitaria berberidis CBS 394.84]|uniref:Glycoside hydrolase family 115 protein n=1 Tax=Cucurbitaria berberidis CBS 394.84 TaxID=1168544 RepID=A0A9P4L9F8_9PLEO|nr:glycoside hydrolase family 115 protein [Cucurbitaria berberidis CBS 394.84]KAF1846398.1 glycoside hydrolase family 115 protein [Cucurbitaria berberidis CBS 394.84]
MKLIVFIISLITCSRDALAIGQPASLVFTETIGALKLSDTGSALPIIIDTKDWPGVVHAGNDLANDFGLVTGTKGKVTTSTSGLSNATVIIAGTIGKSSLIDSLVSSGKLEVAAIKGKWESFTSQVVSDPVQGIQSALVLAGSDKRGTIYAIYDISEQIGVSPWYWWANVPPKKKTNIYALPITKSQGPPTIKYRGIFLNDEQPALTNWVRANYGKYDSRFHAKVFELLLRLRANYFWPAMWDSKFYVDDSKNGPLADEMGIVMGTSHTEPMARADKEKVKPWDWKNNQNNLKKYMQDGLTRAKSWETLWTLGMRGDGDTASPTLDAKSLVDVINYQQSILKSTLGLSNLSGVPQMWCVYKEVGGYYQAGMKIPDDVTILWSDDNSGNIQRLPLPSEVNREGGAGVYYHFDYVGDPRNYKWINTIQLSKTWEQMHLAWQRNATEIWIVNVGDLKPLELPISHFLDMAYNMAPFTSPSSTDTWLNAWATREFGLGVATGTAEAMATYGKLIVRRKYELLNRAPFMLSTVNYDEAENVLNEWGALQNKAQALYGALDAETQIAFFEMVLHPIMAGRIVQQVYINAARNSAYATQKRMSTSKLADDVRAAYAQDAVVQKRYHGLLNGKWNHMMDQVHFGYTNWQDPGSNSMPSVKTIGTTAPSAGILGVSVQNSAASTPGDTAPTLSGMDPYTPENRTIDIYARGSGSMEFTITPSVSYVKVNPSSGTVSYPSGTSDIRVTISVDWTSAPPGSSTVVISVTPKTGTPVKLNLPLNKLVIPAEFKGYIESNGAIAIEMQHFRSRTPGADGSTVEIIPNYGRTHSGLTLMSSTASTQTLASAPKAIYSFYALTSSSNAKALVYLSPSFNVNPSAPLKYAIALNQASPTSVSPVPSTTLGTMPGGWSDSVVNGARVVSTNIGKVDPGKHELSLWLLEPGTVVHRLVVDLGGVQSSYLGPPESTKLGF